MLVHSETERALDATNALARNVAERENPNPKPDDPKDEDKKDAPTNIRLIITAKDNLGIEYDGDAHGENGYDAMILAAGHENSSVTISDSRSHVGY